MRCRARAQPSHDDHVEEPLSQGENFVVRSQSGDPDPVADCAGLDNTMNKDHPFP